MDLGTLLVEKRSTFIKKWVDKIFLTYPADSQRFFRKERDRFANPVGRTILTEMEILYDALILGKESERVPSSLDSIIGFRAVQDLKPSEAVAFVLQAKEVIREVVEEKSPGHGKSRALEALENRIDGAALLAFDIYSKRRERIYDLRVNEVNRQVSGFLRRAKLTFEIPEKKTDLSGINGDSVT
jgi:hypothetical protein